jgi:hypothetical protein
MWGDLEGCWGGEVWQGMHTPPAEAVPAHNQEALILVHHLQRFTASHKAYATGARSNSRTTLGMRSSGRGEVCVDGKAGVGGM